jgi:hypothetical protein
MKKIKQFITGTIATVLILSSFIGCDEVGETTTGGTSAKNLAGEWFIDASDASGKVSEHELFSTYNTAANNNTLWLDDQKSFKKFKIKVTFEKDGSFSTSSASNEYGSVTVTITNGKVEKEAAVSKGGHKVDKISFKAEFSNEPGVLYSYEGSRRTGFSEDE